MPPRLKLSFVLGAFPLLVGTLIYSTWRFTRWGWLENAGLFMIPIGIAAFLVGGVALLWQIWSETPVAQTARRRHRIQQVAIGTLLLVNFPAAAFFVQSAIDVSTRYNVRVVNESNVAVESMVITGPGVRVDLGTIVPGQRVQRHIHFRGDGPLDFSAKQQEVQFGGQLEGYVTHGLGGDKTIIVRRVGVYTIDALTD